MSSTQRGHQRSPADFYETPAWVTYHAIDVLRSRTTLIDQDKDINILEPCAGRGAIVRAASEMIAYKHPSARQHWTVIEQELNPEPLQDILIPGAQRTIPLFVLWGTDFLGHALSMDAGSYDLVLMNPPFRLAMEFIEASLRLAKHVMVLERLNFLGSEDRNAFMRSTQPDVFVIPNRVSFISEDIAPGKCDSIEYAWFMWSSQGQEGLVHVLPTVSRESRRHEGKFALHPRPSRWAREIPYQ